MKHIKSFEQLNEKKSYTKDELYKAIEQAEDWEMDKEKNKSKIEKGKDKYINLLLDTKYKDDSKQDKTQTFLSKKPLSELIQMFMTYWFSEVKENNQSRPDNEYKTDLIHDFELIIKYINQLDDDSCKKLYWKINPQSSSIINKLLLALPPTKNKTVTLDDIDKIFRNSK